jgi:hypothetical protein
MEEKTCGNCDNRWHFDDKPYPCPHATQCYPNSSMLTYGNKSEIDKYWIKRKGDN